MPQRRTRRRPRARQRSGANTRSERSLNAPIRDLAINMNHTFRFSNSSGATNQPVAISDLLGLLVVATGTTAATSLLCAVKIKRLVIRSPAGAGASAYPTVQWLGYEYLKPQYLNQMSLGTANPTVLVSKPPKGADASFMIGKGPGAGVVICNITAPINSVIDLDAHIILQNGQSLGGLTPLTYSSSGLVAGYLYYGQLDKNSGAAKFVPVQVNYYA